MGVPRWLTARRRLPAMFLLVTLVPILALIWLTKELIAKEEKQRHAERVDHAADRIVAASHQALAELESSLRQLQDADGDDVPDHTLFTVLGADGARVMRPRALVFHPTV